MYVGTLQVFYDDDDDDDDDDGGLHCLIAVCGSLRLKFLALWTVEVKRIGKSLVWFLLQVIRDWTPEEVDI